MRISADDPRLTAYALGEMNEEERIQLEQQLLPISPDLHTHVNDIRQMAALLRREFAAENELFSQDVFPNAQKILLFPNRRLWPAVTTAVAAAIILALTWQFWFQASRKPDSSFLTGTVTDTSLELRTELDELKSAAFSDVADMSYASVEAARHLWVAHSGTGLHLDTRPVPSWRDETEHFNFGIGYQLEF